MVCWIEEDHCHPPMPLLTHQLHRPIVLISNYKASFQCIDGLNWDNLLCMVTSRNYSVWVKSKGNIFSRVQHTHENIAQWINYTTSLYILNNYFQNYGMCIHTYIALIFMCVCNLSVVCACKCLWGESCVLRMFVLLSNKLGFKPPFYDYWNSCIVIHACHPAIQIWYCMDLPEYADTL